MHKCTVEYFINDNGEKRWRCNKFLMSRAVDFPASRETCYHYKCQGRRPEFRECRWKDCDKPVAPPKLNHCSELCRQRDFKHAYKMRQKAKKNSNVPQEPEA